MMSRPNSSDSQEVEVIAVMHDPPTSPPIPPNDSPKHSKSSSRSSLSVIRPHKVEDMTPILNHKESRKMSVGSQGVNVMMNNNYTNDPEYVR